jgi:hypothetical protein
LTATPPRYDARGSFRRPSEGYFGPGRFASYFGIAKVKDQENRENRSLFPPPDRPLMTKSEYARHRNCAPSAVTRARKEGRLVLATINGREYVDVVGSDALWAGLARPRGDAPGPDVETAPHGAGTAIQIKAERLRRERAEADLKEMQVRQVRGELIERRFVRKDAADASAIILSAWESFPDRLAPVLVGETDQARIHAILRDEVLRLQGEIADALAAIPTGNAGDGQALA